MSIKRISVTNFKSFKKLEIELGKFNVLIGANASGKSNFVQIFEFLKDIIVSGLDNAVSMQGGTEYLRNMNIGASDIFSLKVVSDHEFMLRFPISKKVAIRPETFETTYEFAMKFKGKQKGGLGFEIVQDTLTHKCEFVRFERQMKKIKEKEKFGQAEIIISHTNGKIKIDSHKPAEIQIEDDIYLHYLREEKLPTGTILLQSPFYSVPQLKENFRKISVYNFDPKLPKKAAPITGKIELEEDGSNLSIVLKNITENKEKRRKLFNLVAE